MRYIVSDIHGCYKEYKALLEKIAFSDEDELFVLGDSMDRGEEPMKVIQDMMNRLNVFYIIGNHDYMMLSALRKLMVEVTEENYDNHLDEDDVMTYLHWIQDGGEVTAEQFSKLTNEEKMDILNYLKEASVYEILEEKEKMYILVHAGLNHFSEDKELYEYELEDLIWHRTDYKKRYFQNPDVIVVTGHTPTPLIREDKEALVFQENGHIALDCACVFGGRLAAYCVETGEVSYVEGVE